MKIEHNGPVLRIWLNDTYAIRKHKELSLYWLEYYNLGHNYMPLEIYADENLNKVFEKYEEVK